MPASNFSTLIQITILHSHVSFYFPAIQTEPPLLGFDSIHLQMGVT